MLIRNALENNSFELKQHSAGKESEIGRSMMPNKAFGPVPRFPFDPNQMK
jgi:hypothetical protein